MKRLSEYIGRSLYFSRKSIFKSDFELITSDEIVAKMYYPKFLSTEAIIEGLDQVYEIKPLKFWGTSMGIFKRGHQMPFSKYENTSFWGSKGEITLTRGEKIKLKFGHFRTSCEIFNASDDLLVTFKNTFSLKEKNVIIIEKRSEILDENPWIIFLTFYKVLQQNGKTGAV